MASPVLQFKRGNIGAAATIPALRPGEPAFTLDKFDLFVGFDTSVAGNKFFGSHRYWKREDATNAAQLKLVDKDGSNYIAIAATNTLSGIATYRLPDTTDGTAGDYLKLTSTTGGYYDLEWAAIPSGSFTLAGDTGTDTFTTGQTLTFTGGTNLNSAITDNTVTFNLDNNVDITSLNVSGITTLAGNITLGDNTSDDITVGGEFVSSLNPSTTNTYDLGTSSQRWRNIWVSGNLNVAGVITSTYFNDLLINNKDIVTAYTDGVSETDDTANHGGIAVASTIGTPLFNISVAGINTLPSTYKQIMWVKSGTFTGLATDAWMFNYGVAIGTSTMGNGVRLAVGSGVTISDTTVSATTFYGNATTATSATSATSASSADQVKTVTASNTNATYYVTFVDANNGSATSENVYTDDGIYYNPGTNTFTTQYGYFTSNVTVDGTLTGTATTAIRAQNVDVVGVATNQNYYITLVDGSGNSKSVGVDAELLYNPNTNTLTVGTGVGITQFSGSVSTGTSTSSVPTSSAIIDYVGTQIGNVDLTLGLNADTGGPSTVNTSQTLTINGTASEVETSVSGQTVTVGLPDAVVVGTSLSAPTIRTNLIKSSDTNATVLTLTNDDASVAGDLTVSGNLYVNGNTTQVNTTSLTVEDTLVELGFIDGAAPGSDLDKDLGLLFNYFSGTAKKAAVFWDDSENRIVFADQVTESSSVLTVASNAYASIEIEGLWVNDCAGQSQVITCTGSERFLQNITVDAGTF